jgi:hypothetical protein
MNSDAWKESADIAGKAAQVIHFKSILARKLELPIVSEQDAPVENGEKDQA